MCETRLNYVTFHIYCNNYFRVFKDITILMVLLFILELLRNGQIIIYFKCLVGLGVPRVLITRKNVHSAVP